MIAPRLLSLFSILVAVSCARGADPWKAPDLASVDELRLTGMWGAAQARNADRMAAPPLDQQKFILADLSLEQIPGRRFTEYSGDISGRWIGAAAFLAPLYPKPFAAFPEIMARIPGYQKADGHFGADQKLPAIDPKIDTPILWGNGRLLIGLVEVFERTGNQTALETAKKLGNYYIATDPVYDKIENLGVGGTYSEGFVTCYFSGIEGLVALGRVTKDNRYLDEAKRIAELALTIKNLDGIHCHGRLTAVRAFADLYAVTNDPHWREAAERDWKTFMERYRLPTGGLKEVLDTNCIRDEGCGQSDWLRLNLSLWRLTGEGGYLDEAERCLKGHFIINQFPNGGAGHRTFHQIGGQAVAFNPESEEAWWCCSKHWTRAGVDIARFAVTSGEQGPCINLIVDCEGVVAGPGGKWHVALQEVDDGLRIALQSPVKTQATLRIHRPAWALEGAKVEVPGSLAVSETKDAWLVTGVWDGLQELLVHLPAGLRSESVPGDAGVLLRGHDLLAAHAGSTNAWLLDAMPGVRPVVLWAAALPARDGRVIVPASIDPNADPTRPEQWKLLELAPLRSAAGQPHAAAWFSLQLRTAAPAQIQTLLDAMNTVPCTPWPAADALGRMLPMPAEIGPSRSDRFVGIFYFLHHTPSGVRHPLFDGPADVSKILAIDPEAINKPTSPLWGSPDIVSYWGEPLFGYYLGDDPWVLRRHAMLLADAGIDVLIFDTTNAATFSDVYGKLCEVFSQIRREGGRTPRIAFMVNTEAGKTADQLYEDLYRPGRHRELWFHWQGKPLLICDPAAAGPEVRRFFTLRRAHWPFTLVNTPYAWHWEAIYPQVYGYADDPDKPEQVNVSAAHNLAQKDGSVAMMSSGNARGRSFHDGKQDTTPDAVNWGHNFQEQWRRAFELQPPFVMVTGWNEWLANRMIQPGMPLCFCDQYNQEFSRDIEPMKGGHGDNYYWQLVASVRRFKGAPPLPKASAPVSIRINGDFGQWRDADPEFLDHIGETAPRDSDGVGGLHYVNRTGRNDLVAMKVARDRSNIYFYVRTQQPMSGHTDPNWMWLLIDIDQNAATGWLGCDFIVNRCVDGTNRTWLERNEGGWQWKKVGLIDYRVEGNELHLAIPRALLGLPEGETRLALDFKWADNLQEPGNPMDLYTSGDTAPEGRFLFRYSSE